MALALDPNTKFVDAAGSVVSGGLLYFGVEKANPKVNPIPIYSDKYLTKVLTNPQTTNSLGQAPSSIYVLGRFSFRLSTGADALIFEDPSSKSAAPEDILFTLALVAGKNVITGSTGTALAAYAAHQRFTFKTAAANTGAVTLNINNLGAKAVVKNNSVALTSGNFAAAQEITVVYNAANDNFEIANQGVVAFNFTTALFHTLIDVELHAGITAGTTQTQAGGFQLLSSANEIATCATENDTVVMPQAVIGRRCEIFNNGEETLQVFPAVGDNIGAGVDVSRAIEHNESVTFMAYDSVNWFVEAKTQRVHGSMFDENNTDAFVVDTTAQVTSYHTNGLAAGDELGWTFDAGGAGTSFPIASVADGADSGVDIEITTTGSHLLSAGAIVSHTGLANAAYRGVFVVKAIISATKYEVAAVFTATGTGTMNEAATLTAIAGSDGDHSLAWSASVTSATNNETFDFQWYQNAVAIPGSSVRRKFGTAADFGAIAGVVPPFHVDGGDKISLVLTNNDTAGNLTIRNLTVVIDRE